MNYNFTSNYKIELNVLAKKFTKDKLCKVCGKRIELGWGKHVKCRKCGKY